MTLDKQQVKKIASLARLNLTDEQADERTDDLNNILSLVEKLQQVDTDGIEPMTSVAGHAPHLREDVVSDGGYRDDVLENAPESAQGFFVVQKVVE